MRVSEEDYSRIIAIGDLHGHYGSLARLLPKLEYGERDLLVFIGDYVDRGMEVKELVQNLILLRIRHKNIIFLKGNHEDMMLGSLGYPAAVNDLNTWLYNGGTSTLLCYGMEMDRITGLLSLGDDDERYAAIMDVIPKPHIDFLQGLELWLETEQFFFCHAGINPGSTIEEGKKNHFDLLWMREHLSAEEYRWEKTLVCGHTPLKEVLITPKLICVDTGLHYYGKLTAVEVGSGSIYQIQM
jgi:serine/threonine protein phosphatase 1